MEFDINMMLQAREEYASLSQEDRTKYLAQLADVHGQDWVDAFTSFMETGDVQKFAAYVKTTAEFPSGVLQEGGTTLEEGYERTPEDVAMGLNADHAPVYEVVKQMGQEFVAASDDTKEKMLTAMDNSKGREFSEIACQLFINQDFCEYIARETQSFFDTLAYDFSESKRKGEVLSNLGDFSETVSNGLLDYVSTGRPSNSAILEASNFLAGVALYNFSENGDLADALQELADGALSPSEAENMANNVADAVSPETKRELEDAAIVDDMTEGQDMSEEDGGDDAVMREREQNNALLDAIVEKYKGLQTPEAKAQMVEMLQQIVGPELVEYIVNRAEGEDFSEDDEEAPVENPVSTVETPQGGDVDHYEALASQLLGQYATDPMGRVSMSDAPVAVSTLPEGAPVASTEGGVTMAEDYQRDDLMDQYAQMGLLK